jgi:dTMP kinase
LRGRFISFEGGEGAGKSTQLRLLAARLREGGIDVVETREPGGTPGAEAIRALLVEGSADRWSPVVETLLMNAARADHVERLIEPALAAGKWVLSDRFADSTRVYQGVAGAVDAAAVERVIGFATGGLEPDLTLVLDLPEAEGLERAAQRGGAARFEAKGAAYHAAVRAGFRALAGGRVRHVDAAGGVDNVAARVWDVVQGVTAGDGSPLSRG